MKPEKIVKYLIVCLIFILIVDPGDLIFHLKTPLFFIIFLGWIADKLITKRLVAFNRDILYVIGLFLLIPVLGLISGIFQQSIEDTSIASGFVKSFSIITLLIIVIDYGMVTDKYLNWLCLIIPIIIIPTYLISLFDITWFNKIYHYLNFEKDVAKFAIRTYFGYTVLMFFYKTSPLLVFPLSYFLFNYFKTKNTSDLLLSMVFLLTLFLSGTRANILAATLVFLYRFFSHQIMKPNKLPLLVYSIVFCVFTYIFLSSLTLGQSETSANVKSGHITSYFILFKQKPEILIWGQGLGSRFYTSGVDEYASQTELTYFELVRTWGVPVTIFILGLILYPFTFLYNNKMDESCKYAIVAYFAYLIIVGTNPLLISSTGLLVIITMYSFFNKLRRDIAHTVTENSYEFTSK